MSDIKAKSAELFLQGYSCSEAIVRAAYECSMIDPKTDINLLNKIASPFSGGMSSGCLCGAVVGAQMILGVLLGREDLNESPQIVKNSAKELIENFKSKRKVTCCKALSAGYDFHSPERRQNCVNIVKDVAEILEFQVGKNLLV